jgi:aminoglycoside phosphotransferase (APT) family kinase protein
MTHFFASSTAFSMSERLPVLNSWLSQMLPDWAGATTITQFPGGYSNLTYRLAWPDGRSAVLRCPPAGAAHIRRGHDVEREFRVLQALRSGGFATAPEPLAVCADPAVLGTPFYLMQEVEGLILRAADTAHWRTAWHPAQWQALSEAFCDQLVALHAVDIHRTGLVQLGKPDGYIRRQVEGWTQRYVAAQTDDLPDVLALAKWLHEHLPDEVAPTLLHNDFKYDNAVLDPAAPHHIRALLDWEMATIGDPRMDLGTALSYWSEAGDGPFERSFNLTWLPGNLTRSAFAERYAQRSGRDLRELSFFYSFGMFKNAVVMQQIYGRYRQGLTQDPRFAGLIEGVKVLAYKGLVAVGSRQ